MNLMLFRIGLGLVRVIFGWPFGWLRVLGFRVGLGWGEDWFGVGLGRLWGWFRVGSAWLQGGSVPAGWLDGWMVGWLDGWDGWDGQDGQDGWYAWDSRDSWLGPSFVRCATPTQV